MTLLHLSICTLTAFLWFIFLLYLAVALHHPTGECVKPTAFPATWIGDCR